MDRVLCILSLWLVLCATGCSSLGLAKSRTFATETSKNPATKCLCLWQQAEGTTAEGKRTRGIAGQVFFFPLDGEIPVKVQGDIRAFLFDDVGSAEEQTRPIHQVALSSAEWNSTITETQFGPAYNIFVPYPRTGGQEVNCALRLRLTRPDGSELFSDMSQVKLAGTTRRSTENQFTPNHGHQKAPEERQASRPEETGIRTTTIGVERDGQMFRATDRIRKIQIGPVNSLTDDDAQSAEINELETKLQRLRAAGQIRQIGHEQE